MFSVGVGAFEGQSAVAAGFSRMVGSGGVVFRAGVTYDSQKNVGANAGVGWRF
jgi:trimeric autotransporter adhesin